MTITSAIMIIIIITEHEHEHEPHSRHRPFSIVLDEPLNQELFYDVLTFWIMRHSDSLLRVKGFLSFGEEPKPHLVNKMSKDHDVCNIISNQKIEREALRKLNQVFIGKRNERNNHEK